MKPPQQRIYAKARALAILLLLVLLSWGVIHVYRVASFKLYAASPSRQMEVRGLPFKGIGAHPLDGCLRVYVDGQTEGFTGDIWQTTIKWGTDLRAEWRGDDHGSFAILRAGRELMNWQVQGARVVCVSGADLITYDPHELWMRTGSALPGSKPTK